VSEIVVEVHEELQAVLHHDIIVIAILHLAVLLTSFVLRRVRSDVLLSNSGDIRKCGESLPGRLRTDSSSIPRARHTPARKARSAGRVRRSCRRGPARPRHERWTYLSRARSLLPDRRIHIDSKRILRHVSVIQSITRTPLRSAQPAVS